jgi:4-oxalocrotonate tautomerase
MPFVNIKITNEGVTSEKKADLIKGVTKLLCDLLGKNPQTTVVVIEEVETDNWGIGGETVTARRKRGQ